MTGGSSQFTHTNLGVRWKIYKTNFHKTVKFRDKEWLASEPFEILKKLNKAMYYIQIDALRLGSDKLPWKLISSLKKSGMAQW